MGHYNITYCDDCAKRYKGLYKGSCPVCGSKNVELFASFDVPAIVTLYQYMFLMDYDDRFSHPKPIAESDVGILDLIKCLKEIGIKQFEHIIYELERKARLVKVYGHSFQEIYLNSLLIGKPEYNPSIQPIMKNLNGSDAYENEPRYFNEAERIGKMAAEKKEREEREETEQFLKQEKEKKRNKLLMIFLFPVWFLLSILFLPITFIGGFFSSFDSVDIDGEAIKKVVCTGLLILLSVLFLNFMTARFFSQVGHIGLYYYFFYAVMVFGASCFSSVAYYWVLGHDG